MAIEIINLQRKISCNEARLMQHTLWALLSVQQTSAEITIVLVNDQRMRALNTAYRGKRKTTDVLSFEAGSPIPGAPKKFLGDIVISLPRAMAQSKELNISLDDELTNLVIHGVCHLLGYDHEENDHAAMEMKHVEETMARSIRKKEFQHGQNLSITGKIQIGVYQEGIVS